METFCTRGTNKLKKKLGRWNRTNSQVWDMYMYRSTNTLLWKRIENGIEKWYNHGSPAPGTLNYTINKGQEIQKPKRAVRVTLKFKSGHSWIFNPGYPKSVII